MVINVVKKKKKKNTAREGNGVHRGEDDTIPQLATCFSFVFQFVL